MRRVLATACAFVLLANPAFAYLKFGVPVGGRSVTLKWSQTPVRYVISNTSVPGVSTDDFLAAVRRAFNSWEAVPTATISYQLAGITTAQTGLPLNRVVQGSTTVPARGTRPNLVSDPTQSIPVNPNGGIPYAFNPFAFQTTLSGQIGNSPRAPFRFPKQFFTDLNVTKNLKFTERYRVQLRAEFYNIFNHTIFNDVFQTIPDRLRGRMAGLELLSYGVGPSAGQIRAGAVAGVTSARFSLASGGLLCAGAVGLVCLLLPGFTRYRAQAAPGPAGGHAGTQEG